MHVVNHMHFKSVKVSVRIKVSNTVRVRIRIKGQWQISGELNSFLIVNYIFCETHGNLIASTVSLRAMKQNTQVSTFNSTGGTLLFSFIMNTVLIYRVRVRNMVSIRVSVSVKVSITR